MVDGSEVAKMDENNLENTVRKKSALFFNRSI
jgi:hypothetical protein